MSPGPVSLPNRWLVLTLAVGLILIGAGVALVAFGDGPSADASADDPRPVIEGSLVAQPVDILRGWDERRATAYAEGDLRALDALYIRGSRSGARDHRMLRQYVDRGLRIDGLRTQLLRAQVIEHDRRRLVVIVTDRLLPATAVGDDTRADLPAGNVQTRQVTLKASAEGWRVAESVRAQSTG